jgi:hypothetical protein
MQTQEPTQHRHLHQGRRESSGAQSRGPAVFYGYCHESNRMRMMDFPDYVGNTQTAYSNLASGMSSIYKPYMDTLPQSTAGSAYQPSRGHESCCHEDEQDCHCSCCIRCADAVEYARCDEVRSIPVTFENDSRRDRDVKLELGPFVTESGKELWRGTLSDQEFKLAPCGEKTVTIRVEVKCGKVINSDSGVDESARVASGTVDSCTVGYATLRAEGCLIRPLVIALAVLPNDCGAHHVGCQCGCCC